MKVLKTFSLQMILLLLFFGGGAVSAHAGEKAGNGGVVFVCADRVRLVDFWEAEDLGNHMSLGNRHAPMAELVKTYLERLKFFETERYADYEKISSVILNDLEGLEKDPYFVTKLVRFTNSPLNFSLDSDELNGPVDCQKAQAVTQKKPQIDPERLLTIYRPLWQKMDNEMRVFTIFHEINIMKLVEKNDHTRWRMQYGDAAEDLLIDMNSTRPARLLNQFLGSPKLAKSKTICDYVSIFERVKMGYFSGFKYGSVTVRKAAGLKCDPETRLILQAPNADERITLRNLKSESGVKIKTLALLAEGMTFPPKSREWSLAKMTGVSDGRAPEETLYESILLGKPKSGLTILKFPTVIQKNVDGSLELPSVERESRRRDVGVLFSSSETKPDGNAGVLFRVDGTVILSVMK